MWVRIDDNFPDHPKVLNVGTECAWMFICALCYANRHQTNGLIPMSAIPRLTDDGDPYQSAKDLVGAGLFETCDDENFYLIHDYLDYQPSYEDAEERRQRSHNNKVKAGKQRVTSCYRDVDGRFVAGQSQHSEHPSSPDPAPTHKEQQHSVGNEPKTTTYPDDFEEFWEAFPKDRGNKYPAYQKWQKRLKDGATASSLLLGAKNYAASRKGEEEKYTKRAQSWLHNRMDEDFQEAPVDKDHQDLLDAYKAWF